MSISLNRLEITGALDDFTPIIVIIEILDSHGIEYDSKSIRDRRYVNKIIDTLTVSSKIFISYPYPKESYPIIGRYVNPFEKWDTIKLLEAFNYLKEFNYEIPSEFKFGYQSNSNPYCLNSCVVYRLCRNFGIKTYRQTTLEEMANCLKLFTCDLSKLKKMINLDSFSKTDIINIINTKPYNIADLYPKDIVEYQSLVEALTDLGTVKLGRITPRTNNEAVVLAAVNFQIDISNCKVPFKEYLAIQSNPENFILEDKNWNKNKDLFDLSKNFNINLPFQLYRENDLRQMAKLEGISESDLIPETCYTELQTRYLSNNFYHGYRPEISNAKTPIYDDLVTDIEYSDLISYGLLEQKLTAYTWTEIYDNFKHYRQFNGADGQPFENVNKLKNLALLCGKNNVFQIISDIEFEKECIDEKVKLLKQCYLKSKMEIIPETVKLLFDSGMYMRGWNGIDDYPVERAPQEDSIMIDLKLKNIFIQIDNAMEELQKIIIDNVNMKDLFLELPLIRFIGGEFQASNDTHEMLTLFDRIDLVKKGESASNMASCIRLSSNWIVASGYYYLKGLGLTPNFNINCLAHIS